MGKTKIQIIDDSASTVAEKKQRVQKKQQKTELAKSESNKVVDEVERNTKLDDSNQIHGAKQINSERSGDASGTLGSDEQANKAKKVQKPGKRTKIRSKKYLASLEKVDRNKNYPLEEAINLAKETSYSKYDGSLEIHLNTNVKNLRGLVSLPFASGKKLTILAFGPSTGSASSPQASSGQVKELEEMGAIIGTDEIIEQISKGLPAGRQGKIDFDVLVTTPDWMPKLARVAKFLGPRGLMPNPKNNTITDDLKKTVTELQSGKTEYKTEKSVPVIHLGLGKISQPTEELSANTKTLVNAIGKTKVKKITLSPTLGPGIKVDILTAS